MRIPFSITDYADRFFLYYEQINLQAKPYYNN